MNTKQTNLLFILLLFLAGISTVVDASEEESLQRVVNKRVQEEWLEVTARATEITGITSHFSKELETTSAESKNTLLWRYSLGGNRLMVKVLVEANADVSAKNEDGCSALTLAARADSEGVAQYLLDQNADVDVKGWLDRTPLIEAAMDDRSNMVKLFLNRGASLEKTDEKGMTALEYAHMLHREEARRILLEAQQD